MLKYLIASKIFVFPSPFNPEKQFTSESKSIEASIIFLKLTRFKCFKIKLLWLFERLVADAAGAY